MMKESVSWKRITKLRKIRSRLRIKTLKTLKEMVLGLEQRSSNLDKVVKDLKDRLAKVEGE
jgi:hypothetical protein